MVYARRTEKFANVSELKLNKDKQFPMNHQNFNNIDCNQYFVDITHYTCLWAYFWYDWHGLASQLGAEGEGLIASTYYVKQIHIL